MTRLLRSKGVYPRQIEAGIESCFDQIEEVSRDFVAVVKSNGKLYRVESKEIKGHEASLALKWAGE